MNWITSNVKHWRGVGRRIKAFKIVEIGQRATLYQNAKKSAANLCQMVTVEIVINLLNGQKSAFFTLAEKLRTGSKNGGHLLGWARMQSLGDIEQRCRCKIVVFVCSDGLFWRVFVTLRGRRAFHSRGYTLSRFRAAVCGFSCAHITVFVCGVRWQNAQFRTAFLVNFAAFCGRISSLITNQFGRSFQHLLHE